MKKICFIYMLLSILLTSCASTLKVSVMGTPGTEIVDSGYKYLATIDYSGEATVTLSRGYYTPFLLSKTPNSSQYVPFALDYENVNKGWKVDLFNVGKWTLWVTSIGCSAGAAIGAIAGAEGAVFAVLGAGAIGGAFGVLGMEMRGIDYSDNIYNYEYLNQQTNNDIIGGKSGL